MAYQSTIPLATDIKAKSQADIAGNFTQLNTYLTVNHSGLNDAAGLLGKHNFVSFPIQAAGPVTVANECALFSKTVGAESALFFKGQSSVAGTGEVNFTTALKTADGWTRLPSGILLKWGRGAANGSTVTAFPLDILTIPPFNEIYQVIISTEGNGGAGNHDYMAYLTAKAVANITVYGSARTINAARDGHFEYLAIGI